MQYFKPVAKHFYDNVNKLHTIKFNQYEVCFHKIKNKKRCFNFYINDILVFTLKKQKSRYRECSWLDRFLAKSRHL